jgi:acyl transferase domain-containing protein/NAD(P)-dependent dehydrogenase (short-subunit alcohol dehydrogenase family)/NAD(P)H-dependent flavin oxidoreductase YrpB (nitropropane dioxygenase family)
VSDPAGFGCLVYTPASLAHADAAVAACRAGGEGVLDVAAGGPGGFPRAAANLDAVLDRVGPADSVGLRLGAGQLDAAAPLLGRLDGRPHRVVLCDAAPDALLALAGRLLRRPGRGILIEVTEPLPPAGLDDPDSAVDGLVACGEECGGFIGDTGAFLLARALPARTRRPVYLRGGVGPHGVAAGRVAGAAGIVLDDQCLLLAESALPAGWRRYLHGLSGQECAVLGETLGAGCRILLHPEFPEIRRLREVLAACERSDEPPATVRARWRDAVTAVLGWGAPRDAVWPAGQAASVASEFAERYGSVGRAVHALRREAAAHVRTAARLRPLAPGAPLAAAHGTRYPVVQGPMTRVSDRAAFAAAVAEGGGLPLLALALMRGLDVRRLLEETRDRLAGQPWGVGILGFVPPDVREEQLAEVRRIRPAFALLAGGRPDQTLALESEGIPTYVHVPVPALLPFFLGQGLRRFVFEGRECGGHVGPLGSLPLWDGMIGALLREVPAGEAARVHVLFAGGIHDARSAAMVAAMAAPLAERGMRVGVLMGTAYLFTREAVASGAIVRGFQEALVGCTRTVTLESALGHANRCAATGFAGEFQATRRRLLREGQPAEAVRQVLDDLLLGRLRIASKGVARDASGRFEAVPPEAQHARGMYMVGDVARLIDTVGTIGALHRDVSETSTDLLADLVRDRAPEAPAPGGDRLRPPSDIAIVGMAALLPGAADAPAYWRNILRKSPAIVEVPAERWDWRLFFDPDPRARDKSYSRWGGFCPDIPVDPLAFGIPPTSMRSISTAQLLALEMTRRVLADAGYLGRDFDHENTAVILAYGPGPLLGDQLTARTVLPLVLPRVPEAVLDRLPEWTEESFIGTLPNVTAGRVANRFDLGGPSFVLDSACASSLTAVDLAVEELESGRSTMAVVGAVDTGQTPYQFVAFSKTQALSRDGQVCAFDRAANGTVISEGVVFLVLKRLGDAERDGDRVYAVIKAVGASSDGKGLGMTAPRPAGQMRALDRAYRRAGFGPSTIDLYEAHGTGTPVGDRAELETIGGILRADGAPARSCAIGSVKSLIGHAKIAAGAASLVKAALALYYRTLPPHAGIEQPLPGLADAGGPLYLRREAKPWLARPGRPRRVGVSAFGFGGSNAHAVLEEHTGALGERPPGHDEWPCELVVLAADSVDGLRREVDHIMAELAAGAAPRLRDLAYAYAARGRADGPAVALVVDALDHLPAILERIGDHLRSDGAHPLPPRAVLRREGSRGAGSLALLFPGQGSHFPDMACEVAVHVRELREALELADRHLAAHYPWPLSEAIYPPAAYTEAAQRMAEARLTETHVAQPAIGAVSLGFLALLRRLGVRPAMLAGHSYGELVALHAAGSFTRETLLTVSETRGRLMATHGREDGAMAAVELGRDALAPLLAGEPGVVVANANAHDQTVVAGERPAIEGLIARLRDAGVRAVRLPVAAAFHSPLMSAARAPFSRALDGVALLPPALPVYANVTARPYPDDPAALRDLLASQLVSPVDFVGQVERMYADGARVFVEVGPGMVLTQLVRRILGERPHVAVALEGQGTGMAGLLQALALLVGAGVSMDLEALHAGRDVRPLDLARLAATTTPTPWPPSTWLVNGTLARPVDGGTGQGGEQPHLTVETAEAERAREAEVGVAGAGAADVPARPDAELLAAYQSYQETMRQFLRTQEEVMRAFLGGVPAPVAPAGLESRPTAEPPPHLAPATPPAEPAAIAMAPVPDGRAGLVAVVVDVVADRTGYPGEMLGLDQDVEADLGIDSIKRLEILETLQRRLPAPLAAALHQRVEQASRLKTLGGLVDLLLGAAAPASDAARAATGEPAGPAAGDDAGPEACPRFVMRGRPQPLVGSRLQRLEGLFLVTADGVGVAPRLARLLRARGAEPAVLDRATCAAPDALASAVTALRARHGPVRGVVHLAPIARTPWPATLAAWRVEAQVQAKSLFQLLAACGDDLAAAGPGQPTQVVAASLLGGDFGRGRAAEGLPLGGAALGLLRTLDLEWPSVFVRIIDFHAGAPAARLARSLAAEITNPGGPVEVGYRGRERSVFEAAAAPLPAPPAVPAADGTWGPGSVVVATGGARGITAAALTALARPGLRAVLIGRTPLPATEPAELAPLATARALREHFVARAGAAGERARPADVERRVAGTLRAREARATLAALRDRGVAVEYHAVDVRDEAALGAVLDDVYARHGRIDAVLHGAGVIEDRLIADKTPESFGRVFDTKVDGAFVLARRLRPRELKLVVFFTSVAGRFGNRGQADYAAANEVLNRLAWRLASEWPATRVLAVNWGPWAETGMAAAEPIARGFEARGVVPIPPASGAAFLRRELGAPAAADVEVIAGQGPWAPAAPDLGALLDLSLTLTEASSGAEPLLPA